MDTRFPCGMTALIRDPRLISLYASVVLNAPLRPYAHRAIDRLILGKLGNRFLSSWSFDLTWEYLMEQPYGDVY